MESRILYTSGIPTLTKSPARINTITVRLNTNGGNLVSGRQLRPNLLNLNHSSPLSHLNLLKPSPATATDSAG